MKYLKHLLSVGTISVATLLLPALSWAVCDITGTGAFSAYELSGQGNFSCGALGMSEEAVSFTTNPDGSLNWSSDDQTQSGEVDALVVEPSSGNRCVYNYSVATNSDVDLSTSNNKAVKAIFGCTNDMPGTPAATKPISSFGDGCTATITCDGAACPGGEDLSVALVYGLEGAAVCQVAGSDGSPFDQVECVDQCVERGAARETDPSICQPNAAGEVPVECSRCLTSEESAPAADPGLRYCTEYTNRSCGSTFDQARSPAVSDRCVGRSDSTFNPRESIGNDGDVEQYDGTTCYKSTKTSGGKTYTYSNC